MALAIAAGAALTGCTDSPPPPPRMSAAPAAPVPVDGSYGGMMQTIRGSAMTCGTQDMFRLTVANNSFRYVLNQPTVPWKPQRVFDAVIAPDGTFQSASGDTYIRGRLSQGHMSGEIVGDACGFRFEADRGAVF